MPTKPQAYPAVSVVTSHGRQTLDSTGDERLLDLLIRHQVPWSAVSLYVVPRSGQQPLLRPCLDLRLSELTDAAEVLVYFNRNVNPFLFSLGRFKTVASASEGEEATEYFYQRLDNERSSTEVFLKKLDPEECRSIVADRVAATVREVLPPRSSVVIGVSGGGDSNALLHGLSALREEGLDLHPVIIKGIPDWDQGVPRAQALCDQYGLDLTIMDEGEVKALLGMSEFREPLIDRFEREFRGDDFEFLGTLLIRLALSERAHALGTPFICTGLNLEDVACEALYRLASGLKPVAVPLRSIGDIRLLMPLWLCPKRIIDGCFPKFSRDNYDARYPCFSLGRNLYYSVVYAMQSQFPAFLEQMVQGISRQGLADPITYTFDEQLGFHVERPVPLHLRRKFQRMRGRSSAVL